ARRTAGSDVAPRREILLDLPPVAGAEALLQSGEAAADVVEHALLLLEPRRAHLRIGAVAVAEEPLEHGARIDLRRQRTVRSAPRHRHVRARVARVAIAGERLRLQTKLQRRELRVPAERPGGDLVGGDAEAEIRAAGL